MRLVSKSPEETMALGRRLAAVLQAGDVVALHGPLGTGKTCFVRGMALGIGAASKQVSSPTFVLCHLYEGALLRLAHLDAYRLRDEQDLESVGWNELLADPRTVLAIEWPERIESAVPERRIDVELAHRSSDSRNVLITVSPELENRLILLEHLIGDS